MNKKLDEFTIEHIRQVAYAASRGDMHLFCEQGKILDRRFHSDTCGVEAETGTNRDRHSIGPHRCTCRLEPIEKFVAATRPDLVLTLLDDLRRTSAELVEAREALRILHGKISKIGSIVAPKTGN
jgi:hypothetical protein